MYHYCCSLPVCLSWPRRPLNQTLPSLRVQYCACSGLRGISAGNFWTLYMANPAQALGRTGFTLATTELLFSGTADVCAGRVLRSPTLLRAVLRARTRRDFFYVEWSRTHPVGSRSPTVLAYLLGWSRGLARRPSRSKQPWSDAAHFRRPSCAF